MFGSLRYCTPPGLRLHTRISLDSPLQNPSSDFHNLMGQVITVQRSKLPTFFLYALKHIMRQKCSRGLSTQPQAMLACMSPNQNSQHTTDLLVRRKHQNRRDACQWSLWTSRNDDRSFESRFKSKTGSVLDAASRTAALW